MATIARGLRDGFAHNEHEAGALYERAAALGNALGRLVDRALRWS